jgi:hypothetical protein
VGRAVEIGFMTLSSQYVSMKSGKKQVDLIVA